MKLSTSVILVRVSSNTQDFERQISDLQNYCKRNDLEIIREFSEKESGRHDVRDELTKLLNFCKDSNPKPQFVVIHELSRIGRTKQVLETIDTLNKLGICLISLKENVRTLNEDLTVSSSAQLLTTILSGISQYELSTMNYRFSSGRMRNLNTGKVISGGNIPLGYKKGEHKMLVIDEEKVEIVQLMFDLYLKGYGTRKIATYLNSNEYTTKRGGNFQDTTVYKTLTNVMYKGERWYKEKKRKDGNYDKNRQLFSCPIIIDPEKFDKVQELLTSNTSKQGINQKHEYLLNHKILTCGVCGRHFIGKKTSKESRYICNSYKLLPLTSCGCYGIDIERLDKSITAMLLSYFPDKIITTKHTDELENQIEILSSLIDENMKQLEIEVRNESKIIDMELSGRFTPAVINERLETVKNNQKRLQREFKGFNKDLQNIKRLYENKNSFEIQYNDILKNGINKEVLRDIVSKIVLTPHKEKITDFPRDKTIEIELCVGDVCVKYLQSTQTDVLKLI